MKHIHIVAEKLEDSVEEQFDAKGLTERASYIYLHGQLDDINGFDICNFVLGNHPNCEGIFPAKVYIDKCTIIYATMFLWDDGSARNKVHGLVVMNGDDRCMKDARTKYDNKEFSI